MHQVCRLAADGGSEMLEKLRFVNRAEIEIRSRNSQKNLAEARRMVGLWFFKSWRNSTE
jgi:hypothetical protein